MSEGTVSRMEVTFEDDIAGFTLSLSVRDVGDIRVLAGGVEQDISVLSTKETWTNISSMSTCPVTYMFQFEPGTTGNTLVLQYVKGETPSIRSDEWMVHQIV